MLAVKERKDVESAIDSAFGIDVDVSRGVEVSYDSTKGGKLRIGGNVHTGTWVDGGCIQTGTIKVGDINETNA